MYLLSNVTRPYAWGSTTAIARALGREPSGGPEAELWIGAHPDAPSIAHTATGDVPLNELIAADPHGTLGEESRSAFGDRLPYLLKLLAAEGALSLQVHPTLEQARRGFAAEEAAGVPRTAAHRNYKDDNHKPEMILALTGFEALCGFRALSESARYFDLLAIETRHPVVEEIAGILRAGIVGSESSGAAPDAQSNALRQAFERLIVGGGDVTEALAATHTYLADAGVDALDASLRTVLDLEAEYPGDAGALISLLLNRVHLEPGECISMPAGNVHAYLHGLGVEVMAASDNVLRGGLTPKHVDVPELLGTIDFRALPVPEVHPEETSLGQSIFDPGFGEFALQRFDLAAGDAPVPLAQQGALLVLLLEGSAVLDSPRGDLVLHRGESAFAAASEAPVMVHSESGCVGFAVTTAIRGAAQSTLGA
ncbi:mannose-6-phosphate isomerase, class I [Psychromicrobium xiongbiense]|uniref:mannose-6-phosphate isomerase, class I n=1 Tax=Psychromicrobium xiongbiense TaxID=3051184 RepID=UPI002553428A|nr:mannose-6-phosphate isomerase, class I [Psychromicrobium sp. YIM S02556]